MVPSHGSRRGRIAHEFHGDLPDVGTCMIVAMPRGLVRTVIKPSSFRTSLGVLGAVALLVALVLPPDARAASSGSAAATSNTVPGAAAAAADGAAAVVSAAQTVVASAGQAAVAQVAAGAATGAGGAVPVTPAQVIAAATPAAVHASSTATAAPAATAVVPRAAPAAPVPPAAAAPVHPAAAADTAAPVTPASHSSAPTTPSISGGGSRPPAAAAGEPAPTKPAQPQAGEADRAAVTGTNHVPVDPPALAQAPPSTPTTAAATDLALVGLSNLASLATPISTDRPSPAANALPDPLADVLAGGNGLVDAIGGSLPPSPSAPALGWPTPATRLPSLLADEIDPLAGVVLALAPIVRTADPNGVRDMPGQPPADPLLQIHRFGPGALAGMRTGATGRRRAAVAARWRRGGRVISPLAPGTADHGFASSAPGLTPSVGVDIARDTTRLALPAVHGRTRPAERDRRRTRGGERRLPAPAAVVQPASGLPVITTGGAAASAPAAGGIGAAAVLLVGALALWMLRFVGGRLSLELSAWRSTLLTLRLERPG